MHSSGPPSYIFPKEAPRLPQQKGANESLPTYFHTWLSYVKASAFPPSENPLHILFLFSLYFELSGEPSDKTTAFKKVSKWIKSTLFVETIASLSCISWTMDGNWGYD